MKAKVQNAPPPRSPTSLTPRPSVCVPPSGKPTTAIGPSAGVTWTAPPRARAGLPWVAAALGLPCCLVSSLRPPPRSSRRTCSSRSLGFLLRRPSSKCLSGPESIFHPVAIMHGRNRSLFCLLPPWVAVQSHHPPPYPCPYQAGRYQVPSPLRLAPLNQVPTLPLKPRPHSVPSSLIQASEAQH